MEIYPVCLLPPSVGKSPIVTRPNHDWIELFPLLCVIVYSLCEYRAPDMNKIATYSMIRVCRNGTEPQCYQLQIALFIRPYCSQFYYYTVHTLCTICVHAQMPTLHPKYLS